MQEHYKKWLTIRAQFPETVLDNINQYRKEKTMKRYVVELANDVEKHVSEERLYDVLKIRNGYINGLYTEFDAVRALMEIVEEKNQ